MSEFPATLERRGHVAVITLNRPKAMNAVNSAMSLAVGTHLEELRHDPDLRVGVVTGAGRAFCAGADLKEIARGTSVAAPGHEDWGFAGITRHFVDKPLVAAVNGYAMGGGTEIALACDLVVASSGATFGLPEVRRGLMAAAGGLIRLQRQLPLKIAMEIALTGDEVPAGVAHRYGIVNRVVEADDVLEAALEVASKIAENAPLSVQASKRLLAGWHDQDSTWKSGSWVANSAEADAVFASNDAREGATAFAEKRPPVWQSK